MQVKPALTTRRAPKRVSAGSSVALSGRVRPSVAVAVLLEREGVRRQVPPRAHRERHPAPDDTGAPRCACAGPASTGSRPRTAAKDGNARGRAVYVRAVRAHTGGVSG